MIQVVLAQPRGFCAGVERAIEIVERALAKFGPPIYVRHEIVHNRHVVEDLRKRGAIFVDELDEIPAGAMTVFSAHGVAKRVEELAKERALPVIDATCPLVARCMPRGGATRRRDARSCWSAMPGTQRSRARSGKSPGRFTSSRRSRTWPLSRSQTLSAWPM
jgi:(E)-4-hydroxy-3-methyl-but-2-enyl pyrophosphate reductase